MTRFLAAAGACTAVALSCAPGAGATAIDGGLPLRDGIVVQYAPGADRGDRVAARADADVSFERTLGAPDFQLVSADPGQSVADAVAALNDDPNVVVAERDGYSVPHAEVNDPLFGQLWGLRNLGGAIGVDGFVGPLAGADIDVNAAWDRTVGTPSTVVAVIDSGYRFDHPDLAGVATVDRFDFVGSNAEAPSSDPDPTDDNVASGGHGTHVAGTVGAAGGNGIGVTGVGQNLRIMALRVCAHSPSAGGASCPVSSQIAAIQYAGSHGARVANMSLGGTSFQQTIVNAIAQNPHVLFVISAGNDAVNNDVAPRYPCSYHPPTHASASIVGEIDNIVCVAATNQADQRASFSNWGATTVDLGAPGTETLSTYPTYTWDTLFSDDFEVDDFATTWSATGASGGFARSNDAELSSFEMSAPPGASAPSAGQVFESTSAAIALPAGYAACRLEQRRSVSLSGTGAQYRYSVLQDGSEIDVVTSTASSGLGGGVSAFRLIDDASLAAGGTLQLRFRYTAGSAPAASNGAWLDDIELLCAKPTTLSLTYDLLQGTSMAAPHVAGAAGLLFSYNPAISVTQARTALLGGVDQVPALAGITVTGGRLDVPKALDLTPPPATVSQNPSPPPPPPPPPKRCKVPKLKGLSLAKAKKRLKKANCALGKVTKPKLKKGQRKLPPLIVKSSKPKAGTERAVGKKVAVTLKPKPKPKKRKPKKRKRR